MPNLETTEELSEQLADWLGVYGACSSTGETGCAFEEKGFFCCRQGFLQGMSERIKTAVKNESLLDKRG